jgi:hypothetical protein
MNKDLLKLKKTLLKVNAPSREKQICKARKEYDIILSNENRKSYSTRYALYR